ncbi:hypothetical protein [Streptomyces sp. NPDC005302]|uniref:hypothetical protein n=1 Tax=Streptomyces sp. NPDC005302 TaxID=3154675 RepID=UPI0033AEFCE5
MTTARRYRLAWLSARRRAADEANFGLEALDREREKYAVLRRAYLRSGEGIADLMAALVEQGKELEEVRQTTDAPPRLECVGTEEDGGTMWQLVGSGIKIR